jgi:hypothetical protein
MSERGNNNKKRTTPKYDSDQLYSSFYSAFFGHSTKEISLARGKKVSIEMNGKHSVEKKAQKRRRVEKYRPEDGRRARTMRRKKSVVK